MELYEITAFGELEVDKHYIVEVNNDITEEEYVHIRVLYKNEDVCLYEIINPNEDKTIKRWTTSGEEGELICVHADITDYARTKKIDNLIGEEKEN